MEIRGKYRKAVLSLFKHKAMVFISGPRQAGKTTLARDIIGADFQDVRYFNYDDQREKPLLVTDPYFFASIKRKGRAKPLVIFDEIHKYRRWKNYLKGVYDAYGDDFRFLVTGSGRLDLYKRGGDSLAGRYLQVRLFPFTISELSNEGLKPGRPDRAFDIGDLGAGRKILDRLLLHSGFPEPYLKADRRFKRMWSGAYHARLVREDVRDAVQVREIDALKTLYSLLPSRVGSPLSVNSLARILEINHRTASSWLATFENLYMVFMLTPWHRRVGRALRKERKLYMFDPTLVPDDGPRLENVAALELSRAVTMWSDLGYGSYSLHYVRTRDGEEVDFLVCRDGGPHCLFEVKVSDSTPSRPLVKIQKMLNCPAVILVKDAEHFRVFKKRGTPQVLSVPMAGYFARMA